MKRTVLWLTTMVLFAGCENSAGTLFGVISGGGGGLTAAQATGNWTFTVQQNTTFPACSAPLANSQTIVAILSVLSDGTLNTTSSWQNPISGATLQPLTGAVSLTSGLADLHFAAPAVRSGAQMELSGTMTALGGFTGTLTDPEPGFSQVFGTGGCQYNVAGIKTG